MPGCPGIPKAVMSTVSGMVFINAPALEYTVMVWRYIMFCAVTSPVSDASTDLGEMSPPIVSISVSLRWSLGGPGGMCANGVVVVVVVVVATRPAVRGPGPVAPGAPPWPDLPVPGHTNTPTATSAPRATTSSAQRRTSTRRAGRRVAWDPRTTLSTHRCGAPELQRRPPTCGRSPIQRRRAHSVFREVATRCGRARRGAMSRPW